MRAFIENFRNLDPEKIVVRHNPLTSRYTSELRTSLSLILKRGQVLGWRSIDTISPFSTSYEVIIFAEPSDARSCGFYLGSRFHYSDFGLENVTIFCFYNGRDKSPCFSTEEDATAWMHSIEKRNNFQYERGPQ